MHYALAHLIGDYILQNDWMATNKKSKSWVCAVHVLVYMIPFLLCELEWWQLSLVIQHFAQDRTNVVTWFMKVKGSEQFAIGPCAPWSIILTDNIIHILWIAIVVSLNG